MMVAAIAPMAAPRSKGRSRIVADEDGTTSLALYNGGKGCVSRNSMQYFSALLLYFSPILTLSSLPAFDPIGPPFQPLGGPSPFPGVGDFPTEDVLGPACDPDFFKVSGG